MAKEKKSESRSDEANFEVSSLGEAKDENGNGVFHLRTKTKIIAVISVLILLISMGLIYLTVEKYFDAQMWQVVVWGLCGILSLYAIFARSIAALLLNMILFAVISFFPMWESGYTMFQPVIEKFSNSVEEKSEQQVETPPAVENKSVEKIETPPAVEEKPEEKIETPPSAAENTEQKDSENERLSQPTLPTI